MLFHEIGHHIHYAVRPEQREKEDVADVWKARLERDYAWQRFRFMRIVSRLLWSCFGKHMERLRLWGVSEEFKKGYISRAEFLERSKGKSKKP